MSAGNGSAPPDIDPAVAMRAQMAMALRQAEAQFPGCHVTIFIADPFAPDQFSYVSSAPLPSARATVDAFLKDG